MVITRILSALVFSNTAEAFGQELAISAVQKQVRMQLAEVPLLIKIARCESDFRQFDESGKPLRNPDSTATGALQIMYSVHNKKARLLGFDLNTIKGNTGYAKHLYRTQGTSPWNASKDCWG